MDEVFTDFLKFSAPGIRALEITAVFVFQMSSLLSCKERNRNYGFKRETQSIHEILNLLAFPEDLANVFLAQKFMSFTTSVLDSGLSAGRDISRDRLCSSFFVFTACAIIWNKLC